MNINALLDLDVVAMESEDRVCVMLELAAPAPDGAAARAPSTLQVVLDRSGSMAGDRLHAALQALDSLVVRLAPEDSFGLVAFDDEVQVVVPAGPLADKPAVRSRIASVGPGGMTNLSGGYLRGLREVDRVSGGKGGTLLLLSDGHANQGVTGHDALGSLAATAARRQVSTSTVGLGLDYDEALLAALARGGGGNAAFAEDGDAAGAAVAAEVDGLLQKAAQAASLVIRPAGDVAGITLYNDVPAVAVQDGLMLELGDLVAGEERRLVFDLHVPAMPALGLAQVAEVELSWVELPSLTSRKVTLPVHVNVVPGDQAAGRIPDARVVSERVFQQSQRAKRSAAEALRRGDSETARSLYREAGQELEAALPGVPAAMSAEMSSEAELFEDLAQRVDHDDPRRVAKFAEADAHRKNRRRGRDGR